MTTEWQNGEFTISVDQNKLQIDEIFSYLSRSYWAAGRSMDVVKRSVQNSLCFGLFHEIRQIGLIRVVTDYSTFAYVCDVYILEEYQGKGLGKWLMSTAKAYPDLQGLRRWALLTRDAHGLYNQYGFTKLESPDMWMEISNPPKPK